jgi:hypothetical protein
MTPCAGARDNEPNARAAYCFYRDAEVTEVAFVEHPTIPMSGASPDGLVGTDGVVEIKCPLTATHLETLLGEPIPAKYMQQMQWHHGLHRAAVGGLRLFRSAPAGIHAPACPAREARPGRDRQLEREVKAFLAELDAKIADLRARYEARAAA